MGGYRYDIFISYPRGGDVGQFVRNVFKPQLELYLESISDYGRPNIFLDESDLKTGDQLTESIRAALRDSKLMIAILCPAYTDRDWCREEWASFTGRDAPPRMGRRMGLLAHECPRLPAAYKAHIYDNRLIGKLLRYEEHLKYKEGPELLKLIEGIAKEVRSRLDEIDEHIANHDDTHPDPLPEPLDLPPKPQRPTRTFPWLGGS